MKRYVWYAKTNRAVLLRIAEDDGRREGPQDGDAQKSRRADRVKEANTEGVLPPVGRKWGSDPFEKLCHDATGQEANGRIPDPMSAPLLERLETVRRARESVGLRGPVAKDERRSAGTKRRYLDDGDRAAMRAREAAAEVAFGKTLRTHGGLTQALCQDVAERALRRLRFELAYAADRCAAMQSVTTRVALINV